MIVPLTKWDNVYQNDPKYMSDQVLATQRNLNTTIDELNVWLLLLTQTLTAVCHLVEESQISENASLYQNVVDNFLYDQQDE